MLTKRPFENIKVKGQIARLSVQESNLLTAGRGSSPSFVGG